MAESPRRARRVRNAARGTAAQSPDALLRRAAERAATRPFFLAAVLLPYARAEGLDDAALAARLGCRPAILSRLLLCRRPRPGAGAFREDAERVAAALGLAVGPLAATIRLAESLAALRDGPEATGWLAAARDREPDPATSPAEPTERPP